MSRSLYWLLGWISRGRYESTALVAVSACFSECFWVVHRCFYSVDCYVGSVNGHWVMLASETVALPVFSCNCGMRWCFSYIVPFIFLPVSGKVLKFQVKMSFALHDDNRSFRAAFINMAYLTTLLGSNPRFTAVEESRNINFKYVYWMLWS